MMETGKVSYHMRVILSHFQYLLHFFPLSLHIISSRCPIFEQTHRSLDRIKETNSLSFLLMNLQHKRRDGYVLDTKNSYYKYIQNRRALQFSRWKHMCSFFLFPIPSQLLSIRIILICKCYQISLTSLSCLREEEKNST